VQFDIVVCIRHRDRVAEHPPEYRVIHQIDLRTLHKPLKLPRRLAHGLNRLVELIQNVIQSRLLKPLHRPVVCFCRIKGNIPAVVPLYNLGDLLHLRVYVDNIPIRHEDPAFCSPCFVVHAVGVFLHLRLRNPIVQFNRLQFREVQGQRVYIHVARKVQSGVTGLPNQIGVGGPAAALSYLLVLNPDGRRVHPLIQVLRFEIDLFRPAPI